MLSLENKEFLKRVFKLAIPIIFHQFLYTSINLVDNFMVGQLGEKSIASVGLANQVFFLYALLNFGVCSGASILMGQYFGSNDIKNLHKTIGVMTIISLIVASIFGSVAFFHSESIMGFYTKDSDVISLGSEYLKIASFSYFLFSILSSLNTASRSTNKTIYPVISSLVALTCNISLNYYFIFKLEMGVSGAAVATLISRGAEVVVLLFILATTKNLVKTKPSNYFSFDKLFFRKYIKTTLPVIINEITWAIGVTLYMKIYGLIPDKFGSPASSQAIIQIVSSVKQFSMVVGNGIGASAGILIGNLLGASEINKAISYSRKYIVFIFLASAFLSAILYNVSPYIVSIYSLSHDAKNSAIISLKIASFILPLAMINFLGIVGILRAGGDTKFCAFADIVSVWFVGVPLGFFASSRYPVYIVMTFIMMEEISKVILILPRILSNNWAKNIVNQ